MSGVSRFQKLTKFGRVFVAVVLTELLLVSGLDINVLVAYADEYTPQVSLSNTIDSVEGAFVESAYAAESTAQTTSTAAPVSDNALLGNYISGICSDTKSKYYYTDSYFFQPSTTYNPSLATMSINLAMEADTYKVNDNYSYGYKNAERAFNEMGFQDVLANDGETHKPTDNSIGVVAANKLITDADGHQYTLIALSIRGADYEAEWAGNVKLGVTGEAEGFATARDQVIQHLLDYFALYGNDMVHDVKIWVMGFSRGSATTNLTGNFLDCAVQGTGENTELMKNTRDELTNWHKVTTEDIFCYGFEVPQGGSDTSIYKAADTSNLWCLVDANDPVPYVAPSSQNYGFYRYGHTVPLTKRGDGSTITLKEAQAELEKFNTSTANYVSKLKMYNSGFTMQKMGLSDFVRYGGVALYDAIEKTVLIDPAGVLSVDNHITSAASESSAQAKSMPQYLSKLVDFVAECGQSREHYAQTIQPTVSKLMYLYMYAEGNESSNIASTVKNGFFDNISYFDTAVALAESLEPAMTEAIYVALGGLSFVTYRLIFKAITDQWSATKEVKSYLTTGWSGAIWRLYNYGYIDNQTALDLNDNAANVIDFAYTLIYKDYKDYDLQYTATGLYYGAELVAPHNTATVTAFLRCNDPNYQQEGEGAYQLSATLDGGVSVHDLLIKLYKATESGYEYLGSIADGVTSEGLTGVGTSVLDDKLNVNIARNLGSVKAEIITSNRETHDLQLSYYNAAPNTTSTSDVQQWFEDTTIALTAGDTIELTMDKDAEEAKYAKSTTASFRFATYDQQAGGYNLVSGDTSGIKIALDGAETTADKLSYDVQQIHEIALSGEYEGLSPNRIFAAQVDKDGNLVKDASGKYALTAISSMPAFSTDTGFAVTSTTYVVALVDPNQTYQVAVQDYLQTAEGADKVAGGGHLSVACTSGATAEGDGSARLEAKPGDTVTVKVSNLGANQAFTGWTVTDLDGGRAVDCPSLMSETLTFVMPEYPVSVQGTLFNRQNDSSLYAVVGGRWGAEYTSAEVTGFSYDNYETPAQTGWSEMMLQGVSADKRATHYLSTGSHVFCRNADGSGNGHLFLSAPKNYTAADGTVYNFLYWKVSEAFGEHKTVQDKIAFDVGLNYSDDDTMSHAYFYSAGTYHAANGCTDNYLVIDASKMTESLHFEPVYSTELYAYSAQLVSGEIVTGIAQAGETVTLTNDDTTERTFENWDVTYATFGEKDTGAGYAIDQATTHDLAVPDTALRQRTLSFTMPAANVNVTSTYTTKTYKLTTSSDVYTDNDLYEYAAGDVVTLRLRTGAAKVVTGWEITNPDTGAAVELNMIAAKNVYGQVDRYSFYMPNQNVSIKPILKDADRYTLYFEGAAAHIVGGEITATGGILTDLYPGQVIEITPYYEEGSHVLVWMIDTFGHEDISPQRYMREDGTDVLVLTMPDCNVKVWPYYTANPE